MHQQTITAFRGAGYGAGNWQTAIDLMARATGSRLGELVGWFSPHRPPFRLMTRDIADTDARLAIWGDLGGADPRINPMIRAGVRARPFQTLVDIDLIDSEERKRNILWNEVFDPCDIPHIASVLLHRDSDAHLVVGVLRRRSQGPLVGEERKLFELYAREAATSATFARKLGEDSGKLVSGALAAVGAAAIALNRFGRVVGITPAAESILATNGMIAVAAGSPRCARAPDQIRFEQAIGTVLARHVQQQVVMADGARAMALTVLPLPGELDLGYNACVLIVLEDVSAKLLLTPAEREVLALLQQGARADEIARARKVSRETARSQIKAVYAKLGRRGQVDLLRQNTAGPERPSD
ncbi:hypothetical protein GCM10011614_18200 [Novosphingobium colocasiae]|uniref:HTH luxR-type domain-containing protein n=1 Tax=Novosphingobium colocasiae TaxID=1256513 RepID=A0A918UG30_9SPHN|nr:hypothetical protein GCM10011614_18200 [Novosphingobium colocasiae]